MSRAYPDKLEIVPLTEPPRATVRVPGSKSITNRALVLAALASQKGSCELGEVLQSEDTEAMIDSLGRLGFDVRPNWQKSVISVHRHSGALIPAERAEL